MPGDGTTERNLSRTTPGTILLAALMLACGIKLALVHPAQNYLLDFRAYYAAATAGVRGVNPYDTGAVRARVSLPGRQRIVGYLYPPVTLWLFVAFARLPYPAAQVPWLVLQFALAVAAFALMLRALGCQFGSPASVLLGFAFFASAATWELFRWGQFDMIVLFLLTLGLAAMLPGPRAAAGLPEASGLQPVGASAGLWLGLAAGAKVTPVVYLGLLAARRQWKPTVAGAALIIVLIGAGLAWPGAGPTLSWLRGLRDFSGDVAAALSPNNVSLRGLVYRLFVAQATHEGPSTPLVALGLPTAGAMVALLALLLGAATVAWMWRHRRRLNAAESICAAIPLVLLLSPITTAHHCVQMLPALACVIVSACRGRRLRLLDAAWLLLIIVLFVLGSGGRIASAGSPRLNHLISPTTTYALVLTWLFFMARYVPLKQAATARPLPG